MMVSLRPRCGIVLSMLFAEPRKSQVEGSLSGLVYSHYHVNVSSWILLVIPLDE